MDKEQIIRRSKEVFNQFTDACLEIPDGQFFFQPQQKWSIAENADHLTRAIKTTQLAYSLPKSIVRLIGGKPNRASRSYEELVKKYKLKLEQGGKARGQYIPKVSTKRKFTLMQHWQKRNERYLECLELKWKDPQLDKYLAPHPLLGKITLRELCYFTIYHTEHHLNIIKTRLSGQLV